MSPSVSANVMSGKRCQKSAQSRSPRVKIDIAEEMLIATGGGASAVVPTDFDDEPTWQHSTVPVSEQAANSGSHASVWILGMPRPAGFSENVIAWHPLSARRCTSFAASSRSEERRVGKEG